MTREYIRNEKGQVVAIACNRKRMKLNYTCPRCQNSDHVDYANYCKICGMKIQKSIN